MVNTQVRSNMVNNGLRLMQLIFVKIIIIIIILMIIA